MAVNTPNGQYIGARYVPKVFKNPVDGSAYWKANTEYEALTIVVVNSGDSYTSRQAVPRSIGSPEDNPDYWTKTGDFNASLLAVQNRLNNIENTTIPAIQEDIEDINNELDLKPLSGIIVVTDSYGGTSQWHTKLLTMLSPNVSYHSYQSGASFNGGTFLSQLTTIVNALTTEQKRVITDVIIGGGYNDRATYPDSEWINTVKSGIRNCLNYINANLPNATLHVACIGYCYNDTDDFNKVMFANYIYEESCANLGIHCMKLPKYGCVSLAAANEMFNNSHPNSNGGDRIASLSAMELLGDTVGQSTPVFYEGVNFTFNDSQTPSPSYLRMNFWQSNTKLLIDCVESSFGNFTIDLSAQQNREVIIATAQLPRDIHFNHVYRLFARGLAIYNTTGRVITGYIIEFTQNTINLYIQNEYADTLNRINVGPFNLEVDNYTK